MSHLFIPHPTSFSKRVCKCSFSRWVKLSGSQTYIWRWKILKWGSWVLEWRGRWFLKNYKKIYTGQINIFVYWQTTYRQEKHFVLRFRLYNKALCMYCPWNEGSHGLLKTTLLTFVLLHLFWKSSLLFLQDAFLSMCVFSF